MNIGLFLLNNVFAEWQVIQKREDDLEYAVEHYQNDFYIITNETMLPISKS